MSVVVISYVASLCEHEFDRFLAAAMMDNPTTVLVCPGAGTTLLEETTRTYDDHSTTAIITPLLRGIVASFKLHNMLRFPRPTFPQLPPAPTTMNEDSRPHWYTEHGLESIRWVGISGYNAYHNKSAAHDLLLKASTCIQQPTWCAFRVDEGL